MEDEGLLNKWLGCLSRDGSALETVGNRVQLFFEGDDAFREMWEAIEGAEHYVHQEMYMFLSDEVGWALAEAFAGAARRGEGFQCAWSMTPSVLRRPLRRCLR